MASAEGQQIEIQLKYLNKYDMREPWKFSARKTSPAVYFNDGHHSMSVQTAIGKGADPLLLEAIVAAWREFNRVYFPALRDPDPEARPADPRRGD